MKPISELYRDADFPPRPETITDLRGRCVVLDEDGNVPTGERLFDVREIPNPWR
jgi:hypothetical protein